MSVVYFLSYYYSVIHCVCFRKQQLKQKHKYFRQKTNNNETIKNFNKIDTTNELDWTKWASIQIKMSYFSRIVCENLVCGAEEEWTQKTLKQFFL